MNNKHTEGGLPSVSIEDAIIQPFNLETALKHPEWVYFRNGEKPLEWHSFKSTDRLIALKPNGWYWAKENGELVSTYKNDYDLILRVPYREIWVVLYENREAYWYNTEHDALEDSEGSDYIACVSVKAPVAE